MATIHTLTLSTPKLNTSSSSYLKPNSPASLSVVHCCFSSSSYSSSPPYPSSVQPRKSLINAGFGFLVAVTQEAEKRREGERKEKRKPRRGDLQLKFRPSFVSSQLHMETSRSRLLQYLQLLQQRR
ncbi:hypothetical protein CDL15_Pgr028931 [Punica granatum]|uniref:Uncharacterized protein n=1 Tax=Punica granatum TaxID=22663 RepID=A0A218WX55_PUNGR|nr:hypothetical protein CDL15_Pgr028931 [Punica granatum]